ncbi:MAG: beta-lactamase family protein [Gemmatimonadaceae bacterium]|nr:beta-lactamase family protein [Gemmatimonadaceae bacterium]
MTHLPEMLAAAAKERGAASVAIIEKAGAEPQAYWVPESDLEPAFLAYSITKTFTAVLILRLCEERRLGLDDRLVRWFPHITHADQISLRRLLNHTAGIPDYGGLRAYHEDVKASPSTPWSFDRFAAETFDKGLLFDLGEGWAYSNPGYMLLKRIAEEAAGDSYRDLISEYIAGPLGLRRTFVAESITDLAALAPGTSSALSPDGASRDVRSHYHPGWVSHGVVASTASELVRFLDSLFRGALLTRHSIAQMMELVTVPMPPHVPSSEQNRPPRYRKPSYGLGLMGDPASPRGLIVGHNGGGPCYSASAFHAFDLGGASVCAMGAIEEGFDAAALVFDVLDHLNTHLTRS